MLPTHRRILSLWFQVLLSLVAVFATASCGDGASSHPWAITGVPCPTSKSRCAELCVDLKADPINCGECGHGCGLGEVCSLGKCALFCADPLVDCGGLCADLRTDVAHCGTCSTGCPKGSVCQNSKCELSCIDGDVPCGGACANLQADPKHCGKCEKSCVGEEFCSSGECKLPCTGGQLQCGDKCVDLASDVSNCAGCGQTCPAGNWCVNAKCVPTCQVGMAECGAACVDLDNDLNHCGNCDKVCAAGQVCSKGQCTAACATGQIECGGKCSDPKEDSTHCGDCETACKAGQLCSGGKCTLSCQEGLIDCEGVCANPKTDITHCGGCYQPCATGSVCVDGACSLACPGTMTGCEDGLCADLTTDPLHCGSCSTVCAPGEKCTGGKCLLSCQSGFEVCAGTCVDYASNNQHCGDCETSCATGQQCKNGKCVLDCQPGLSACGGTCVDVSTNNANCGDCDQPCPLGHVCQAGNCKLSCQQGMDECSGTCSNLKTDELHCGSCDKQCASGMICVNGKCTPDCPVSQVNCGGNCSDLQVDHQHCGDCDTACSSGEICFSGKCVSSCKSPLLGCGNVCIDPNFDPNNCGDCGQVCQLPNAVAPACMGGACQVTTCQDGYANCDNQSANGCEIELKSSGLHCGACNKVCTLFKAIPSCQDGKCVVTACEEGWGDCNGNADDGCEQDLGTSAANCGGCGIKVAAGEVCCGAKPVVGSSYATDSNNCGACGNVCGSGQVCCGGFCYTVDGSKICPDCGKLCNVAEVSGNKFITTGAVSKLEASGSGISTVSNEGGKNQVATPRVWIAAHDSNLVNRLDTGSGKLMSVFPSFGSNPSRGAVALDDTFWIGNRCPSDANNPKCSNVAQLNSDGTLGCLVGNAADGAPLPLVRAIAVDDQGFIWLGTWNDARIHKIDPLACKTIADYTVPVGASPYGFAIDSTGLLWISSPNGPTEPLRSFDTKTGKLVDSVARNSNTYGVVVDGDSNVWFASWCTPNVLEIDKKTKALTTRSIDGLPSPSQWCARGMAVDVDGNVWAAVGRYNSDACAAGESYVAKYQKTTGKFLGLYKIGAPFGGGALGISMDANGRLWVTSTCTNKAARINKDTGATELVADLYGTNPYTYSDWTGAMLKNVTTHNGQMGLWTANFDGNAATAQWQQATYTSDIPAGTRIRLRFRASSAIEAIEGATWCVPAETSPVDLKSCNFGQKRYLQAQVYLITNDVDVRPTLDNFKVYWQN